MQSNELFFQLDQNEIMRITNPRELESGIAFVYCNSTFKNLSEGYCSEELKEGEIFVLKEDVDYICPDYEDRYYPSYEIPKIRMFLSPTYLIKINKYSLNNLELN